MVGELLISIGMAALALGEGAAHAPADNLPIITEVLYAVPKGIAGDASQDGSRHPTGDEFVEIHNPTSKPIRLSGWTITDRNKPDAGQFLFVFPNFRLGPGETAVVFNGLNQTIPGPLGDAETTPPKPNDKFNNAWVFTAGNTSSQVGFANAGDWVCLRTPKGEVVSCLTWGTTEEPPPVADPRLVQLPRTSTSSVQRTLATAEGVFEAHPTVRGLRCSPGTPPPPAPPAGAVAAAPDD
ncbi:MAG: lamin tail domain-containing protein [Planctomycetota bacterium]|nr:lamin tail domain-containing protein [Planctomycetota bacterium]